MSRIKQVISNLVNNAIKFTDSGEIKIVADLISSEGNILNIVISVVDQGVGIPEEHLDTIFNEFDQKT